MDPAGADAPSGAIWISLIRRRGEEGARPCLALGGAPHVFPPEDFAVFTLGARPADDTLEALWGRPDHSLVEIERAIVAVIGSEPSPKGELSAAVTASVPGAGAVVPRVQGAPPERERIPGGAAAGAARPDQHGPGAADQGQDMVGRRRQG